MHCLLIILMFVFHFILMQVSAEELNKLQIIEKGKSNISKIIDDIQNFKQYLDPQSTEGEGEVVQQQKIEYHVPKFRTDHSLAVVLANQMHQKKEKYFTRLPMPESITPSPFETYASMDQVNFLSTKHGATKQSLSSRYNPYQDFTRQTERRPVGPQSYNISRHKMDLLSTSRATPEVQMHHKHFKTETYGPGPGKYNTKEAYDCCTPQLPKISMKFRNDNSGSASQMSKKKMPGPQDYDVVKAEPYLSRSLTGSGLL